MKIYVNSHQPFPGAGTKACPFSTIQQAADAAMPGDEVLVAPGIYREDVHPLRGGSEEKRITYCAEIPGKSIITGAEVLSQWEECGQGIWKTVIPNDVLGEDNPFADLISGDWYYDDTAAPVHRADIYLDSRSLREVFTQEELFAAEPSPYAWDMEFSRNVWMSERTDSQTTIYLHLLCGAPIGHLLEYSARRHCFYPTKTGVNYLTLSGFVFCKAAPQWAPPTAYQEGMVGPHWAKGWVIEDCELYESKCVGISLGKYLQPNNENKWRRFGLKHGTQNERDAICQAQLEGWDRAHIGSHVIRRCCIHDCGQAGIAGHLGCVFSVIEDNHIHHINNKQELNGAEIGGIKLHAAIDTIIAHNHIHHCTRGLWLDWQAQGTRVTGNTFHHNQPLCGRKIRTQLSFGEDIFVEVSHGPTLIDHNLLLSSMAGRISTQGIAFVQNLIAGSFTFVGAGTNNAGLSRPDSVRYTPYHVPHQTAVAGFMSILHGDAQFWNNLFIQQPIPEEYTAYINSIGKDQLCEMNLIAGTLPYQGFPTESEYLSQFTPARIAGDRSIYYGHLPVKAGGNVYLNGARPADCDADSAVVPIPVAFAVAESGVTTNLYDFLPKIPTLCISSDALGSAFEPEQRYEAPDGSSLTLDTDMCGKKHALSPLPGPFAAPISKLQF